MSSYNRRTKNKKNVGHGKNLVIVENGGGTRPRETGVGGRLKHFRPFCNGGKGDTRTGENRRRD